MWKYIIISVLLAAVAGSCYLVTCVRRMEVTDRLSGGRRWLSWLLAAAFVCLAAAGLCAAFDVINAVICLLHLTAFRLLFGGGARIFKAVTKRSVRRNTLGAVTVLVTMVYLCIGWYLAHHVAVTTYSIETEKAVAPLKLVQISDSHIGATFDAAGFAKHLETVQALEPDVVVVTGDFVDDDTTRGEMLDSCRALGTLRTRYGVYFSYGNHDRGYGSAETRGWFAEELAQALRDNGVVILQDDVVELGEDYELIGREDQFWPRLSMEEITEGLDREHFSIVLDHQPADYEAQEAAEVDLVLSGHTHGGQMFPIHRVGEWTGVDCMMYGLRKSGNTNFIVNSGIGCWALQFKTGCKSEIVMVEINSSARGRVR